MGGPATPSRVVPVSVSRPEPVPHLSPGPAELDKTMAAMNGRRHSDGTSDTDLTGWKSLVVDDDFRNVFALTALLERVHAEVLSAESGSDALLTLERVPSINVVLMDIMMPGMDGYDTMRAIRAIEQFKNLPIIAVTGKVMAGERQRCVDAGANHYVPKPVDSAELLSALSGWLPKGESSVAPEALSIPEVIASAVQQPPHHRGEQQGEGGCAPALRRGRRE